MFSSRFRSRMLERQAGHMAHVQGLVDARLTGSSDSSALVGAEAEFHVAYSRVHHSLTVLYLLESLRATTNNTIIEVNIYMNRSSGERRKIKKNA